MKLTIKDSFSGERGSSVVECRTPEREVRGSRPTSAVLCPWARHFTPRKYWLITQEAMAPSRHDWKIVDWDVKPQHNQPKTVFLHDITIILFTLMIIFTELVLYSFSWRAMVLGSLQCRGGLGSLQCRGGRPTTLAYGRTGACCACNRCGTDRLFFFF